MSLYKEWILFKCLDKKNVWEKSLKKWIINIIV